MAITIRARAALLAAALVLPATAAQACSSCGCTLSSDWGVQGYGIDNGLSVDLRYDFYNQNQLRSGTGVVDTGAITLPTDQEIQVETINRGYWVNVDYAANASWGVNLQLPWIDRYHTTIAEGETALSTADFSAVGDLRVIGRYQGFTDDHSVGVQFGLKLPTGGFHKTFIAGPEAGEPLDRGLQPGTGTTDVLLGVYAFGALNREWDWFGQALAQVPLNTRDQFKPGAGINVNGGVRYMAWEHLVPQIQLNVRSEQRESGEQADVANSGATLAYVSPGVTWHAGDALAVYAFLQVPVYQRVNGLQLEPRYSVTLGVRYAL